MASKNRAVFGIFASDVQAKRAVDLLIDASFLSSSISVLLPDVRSTREFAHEKHTKAPEGATLGGVIGGAVGIVAGVSALAIPGLGAFLAAGPIIAGLAGMGAGGVVGGLVGWLVGMGIPEYEAKRYEGRVKEGGTLLSVHCNTSDEVARAKHLLEGAGASDVSSASESGGADARDDKHREDREEATSYTSRHAAEDTQETDMDGVTNLTPNVRTERKANLVQQRGG